MAVKANPSPLATTSTISEILRSYSTPAQGIDSLFRTATTLVSSHTAEAQCRGLSLFRLLACENYKFTIEGSAASGLIFSTDSGVRAECAQLFLTFIKKARELDYICDVTKRLFQSSKPLSSESIKLFAALVGKKKAFTDATVAAEFHVLSLDATDQVLGISLYEELVKAEESYDNAASAAFRLYKTTENKVVREGALALIKTLLCREMAHEEAFNCASSLVHADQILEVQRGQELYQEMLQLKYFSPRIVEDGNFLMTSTSSLSLYIGLQLFTDLARAGQAREQAERAAGIGLKSVEKALQSKALALMGVLAEKNFCANGLIAAACSFIRSQDEKLQALASPLMTSLIRQHQMFEMAEDAAKFLYTSVRQSDQYHSLTILIALVEKGQSYDDAEDIACVLAGLGSDLSVLEKALELFSALVQKGQALASARRVAGNLVSSRHQSVGKSALHLLAACKDKDKKESK